MGSIKKKLITVCAALSLMLCSTTTIRADVWGAGDAALLAQQLAQFWQDFKLDKKKWDDIQARLDQVDRIAQTITKGQQAYSSINNIIKTGKQIVRTGKKMERYIDYLKEFGSEFRLNRAYYIYNNLMNTSKDLYNEVSKSISSFGSLTDLKPLEMINAVDQATSQLSETLDAMSEQALSDLSDLCYETAIDQNVEANKNFVKSFLGY